MTLDLETIRDLVIILYGSLGLVLMIILVTAALGIWFAIRSLLRHTNKLLSDPIEPTLQEAHKSVQNIRAATEFVSDTAVHPVIRLVSFMRGIRKGISVVAGLGQKKKSDGEE